MKIENDDTTNVKNLNFENIKHVGRDKKLSKDERKKLKQQRKFKRNNS